MKVQQVIGNRIMVKPLKIPPKIGSLYVPDPDRDILEADVIAIGDKWEKDSGIDVGDRVIYDNYAILSIESEGEKYLLLTPDEVIGKVETSA